MPKSPLPLGAVAALLAGILLGAACTERLKDEAVVMDEVAEAYVKLTLAIGRWDPDYVDAYYGPKHWKEEADAGEPRPLAELRLETRELLNRLEGLEPSMRREFLHKQLVAADTFLRRLEGEAFDLSEEAHLLFDVEPPVFDRQPLEKALARLDELLPGEGDVPDRLERFRAMFRIPPDRLRDVVQACLAFTRGRTTANIALPEGEAIRVSFVQNQPWGAYNWYLGGFRSKVEFNTDLPSELMPILSTVAHEAYPGHHTYNALLEDRLVRGQGWVEFMVYPLYSPQSLIAEGTANAGLDVVASEDEQWEFIATLAPLAGLDSADLETYRQVLETLRMLRYVRAEAARMLLDEGRPDEEVVAFLRTYGLRSEVRARKDLEFIRKYRSYVFNYTAGDDLIRGYVGEGTDRAERYFWILQNPVTPNLLRREAHR